jgi:phospholipid/cholesterol/gamma-HCH transport system substrate-binding protein
LFIMGFSYLKSSPIFDNSKTLYAVFNNVGGLQTGTVVSINGFAVGKVTNIKFLDAQGNLQVTFSVDSELTFSKNSSVELYDTGIIGGKGLQIHPVFDEGPTVQSGDTLKSSTRPGLTELAQEKLTPLVRKFESAISDADSVLMNVNDVLDAKTKKDLQGAITGLNALMASLNGSATTLDGLLQANEAKLGNSLASFEQLSANFAQLSDSLNNAGLPNAIASLSATVAQMDKIMAKINSGNGTLGKLMNDGELYAHLNSASRELDLLLQDFRLNPKRYVNVSVFGKKQKDYTVPEEDPAEKIEE